MYLDIVDVYQIVFYRTLIRAIVFFCFGSVYTYHINSGHLFVLHICSDDYGQVDH